MKYNDFTLVLEKPDGHRWQLRVESENQGESEPVYLETLASDEIDEINRRFENRETDRAYLKKVGQGLFERVITGQARDIFNRSLGEVRNDAKRGLRLRFRIMETELSTLPWELIYSELDKAFVGTRVKTPIVRYLDMPMPRMPLAAPYPVKVLAVIPLGDGTTAAIDESAERNVIDSAVKRLQSKVEITYLADQFDDKRITWMRLVEALAEGDFHCIHYIGHGAFRDDRGCILLDGEEGGNEFVDENMFAEAFVNAPSLKLVILNACNTAQMSSSRPLAGVAASLVRAGIPAVVAMQFSILDKAAVAFSRVFYQSLFASGNRGRVDVAVSRGRQILAARFADERELAAPVLFTHAKTNVLLVPESEGTIGNIPVTSDRLDALVEAQESTGSSEEKERFARRIKIGRGAVRAALLIGLIVFLMSAVRVLDIFTIDTRAEFVVMALGNGLVEHRVSDELRILTASGKNLTTPQKRQQVIDAIQKLKSLGARTVALDIYYAAENGEFKTDVPSGLRLANEFAVSPAALVVAAKTVADDQLEAPDAIRRSVSGIGLACFESKLGLARSLPIAARVGEKAYPSFALAAVGAHRGGRASPGFESESVNPYLSFADKPSLNFAVSEYRTVLASSKDCEALSEGSQVAHRFVRRTPDTILNAATSTIDDLQSATDTDDNLFADKLVVFGFTDTTDIVADLAGQRDGVFWQADAINNLLLDEEIIPVRDFHQLLLMLAIATGTMVIAIRLRRRRNVLRLVIFVICAMIFATAAVVYGEFGLLLNPVYLILAAIMAYWIANRYGERWVVI